MLFKVKAINRTLSKKDLQKYIEDLGVTVTLEEWITQSISTGEVRVINMGSSVNSVAGVF